MTAPAPRWRRRKTARPGEILAAALEVFAEKGFAAARLEEIADRAGVSKAALYLYFETKDDLFRAVARDVAAPGVRAIAEAAQAYEGRFADLAPMLLAQAAALLRSGRLPAIAKMVIGESRNFPDLARIWHDSLIQVALEALTGLIERAQARGEVRAGDPRLMAFSLMGPMFMGALFAEVFAPVGAEPPDLAALARQHAQTALTGMLETRA